jgi:hypothetical protein
LESQKLPVYYSVWSRLWKALSFYLNEQLIWNLVCGLDSIVPFNHGKIFCFHRLWWCHQSAQSLSLEVHGLYCILFERNIMFLCDSVTVWQRDSETSWQCHFRSKIKGWLMNMGAEDGAIWHQCCRQSEVKKWETKNALSVIMYCKKWKKLKTINALSVIMSFHQWYR